MRVLFIYSNQATYIPPHYHHGIGHLSSALKAAGHKTSLIVLERHAARDELVARVKAQNPDVIAFSSATNQYKHARQYSTWLKEELKLPLVVGGAHPTFAPERVMAHPAWDFLVAGEGDEAIVELIEALNSGRDTGAIANVWSRRNGEILRNPTRPLIADLDSLPLADREIFDAEHLLRGMRGAMSVIAGRGCPYGCAYCSNPAFQRLYRGKGKWVRLRSAESVIKEIGTLIEKYPVRFLYFDDDMFTLDKEWMTDFLTKYKGRFKTPFRVNVHVDTVERGMLEALKDAGCEMIQVGVEHGDEEFRRKVLRRPMTNEQIANVFRWADEIGIRTWSFNIVGFPGETLELARKTLELNKLIRPDHMQVSIFNPYPGTALYDEALEKGYLDAGVEPEDGYFVPETGLRQSSISPDEIKAIYRELLDLSDKLEDERRIERKYRGRKIYYNLTDMLAVAEVVEPSAGYVGVAYFSIDDDVRRVLQEHPNSTIKYELAVPENAALEFAIAVHPAVWEKAKGDGVEFKVEAAAKKLVGKAVPKQIFCHVLDPRHNRDDRGWFEFSVDLSKFAGKKVALVLRTSMANNSESDFNTAGWANPVIVDRRIP